MDKDENMITQRRGKKIYNKGGTSSGLSVNSIKGKAFNRGRRTEESHKPNAVLKPSRSMDNKAKLIEKRLSIVQSVLFKSPNKSAVASMIKRGT